MNNLATIQIEQLMASFFKNDEDFTAIAKSVSEVLNNYHAEYQNLLGTNIPEQAIEHLLWEHHVDFFDQSLTVEQKKKLIEESDLWHERKGTPWAVEQAISSIFGDAQVKEWFEYDGDPYHFKVETSSQLKSAHDFHLFLKLVDSVKRKSTRLEGLVLKRKINGGAFIGGLIVQTFQTVIRPSSFKMEDLTMNTFAAGAVVEYKQERMK